MGTFRVTDPGALSLVQDLGREGFSALGVPAGGAVDQFSLRIGNRLMGNPDNTPALEMALTGGSFVFDSPAVFVIAGADTLPSVEAPGKQPRPLLPWAVTRINSGETLRTGRLGRGMRIYLCIAGGIKVPSVLTSASTHLGAGFGGYRGRALREGDQIQFVDGDRPTTALPAAALAFINEVLDQRTLRAVSGAHADAFDDQVRDTFWTSKYTVTPQSNRVGLMLEGPPLAQRPGPAAGGRMISEGMPAGAVQVPPAGKPAVLMADHPTTGGYPAIACVASADLPVVGQLRPHNSVTFQRVSQEEALSLFKERERRLDEALPQAVPNGRL